MTNIKTKIINAQVAYLTVQPLLCVSNTHWALPFDVVERGKEFTGAASLDERVSDLAKAKTKKNLLIS